MAFRNKRLDPLTLLYLILAVCCSNVLVQAKPPIFSRTRLSKGSRVHTVPLLSRGGGDGKAKISIKNPPPSLSPLSTLGFSNLGVPGTILLASSLQLSFQYYATIPRRHLLFAVVYPLYIGFINRIRFQCNEPAIESKDKRVIKSTHLLRFEQGPWFMRYLSTFGILGILLPLLFCWAAPAAIAIPAVPHTMLILAQVITESLTHGPTAHMLPTLLVPIGFNAYRMGSLMEWVQVSWQLMSQHASAWTVLGVVLGVINLVIWTYNLFVFLLLRVSPQYWDTETFPVANAKWKGQLWPVVE